MDILRAGILLGDQPGPVHSSIKTSWQQQMLDKHIQFPSSRRDNSCPPLPLLPPSVAFQQKRLKQQQQQYQACVVKFASRDWLFFSWTEVEGRSTVGEKISIWLEGSAHVIWEAKAEVALHKKTLCLFPHTWVCSHNWKHIYHPRQPVRWLEYYTGARDTQIQTPFCSEALLGTLVFITFPQSSQPSGRNGDDF